MLNPNRGGAEGGTVNLPYSVGDNNGNTWMIYQGGWVRDQSNQTLYSQGAMLQINGNQPSMNTNQGVMDEKTGELVLENLNANGFLVTRRILINREDGYVRYIDIIKNSQQQEASPTVSIQTSFNYCIQFAQMIADPRKKDQNIAYVGQTGAGRCVMEIYGGKGANLVPSLNCPPNNSQGYAQMQLTIPAGKQVAIMHLHMVVPTLDAGNKFVADLKESKLLQSILPEVRKILVNFPTRQNFLGDCEILRGDVFDVVELRGGDQVKGAFQEPSFKLDTFYGPVELPADQVAGMISVGDVQPRQLLVLFDGQIFGGRIQKDALQFQLSNGRSVRIPLNQVTRAGSRKRPNEPEEWVYNKPFLFLCGGDRVKVQMPTAAIPVVTRYGTMQLKPEAIGTIIFQSEEHGVHEIRLTDGSRFVGLVNAERLEMKLDNSPGQAVGVPLSAISRLQLSGKPEDADESAPALTLTNKDMLAGVLQGQLTLDTAFETLTLNGPEIRRLVRQKDLAQDVQVTLWDGSTLSGRLRQTDVECLLGCGQTIKAPVALIAEYNQPQPLPSPAIVEKIKALVVELNADDCKQRDQAEAQLVAMGQAVVGVLKQLRPTQPLEAQQRIDSVVAQVEKKKSGKTPGTTPPVTPAAMIERDG